MKLTSPNYPESYDPNTVCKWHLTTDEGNYISFDLEHIYVSDKDNDVVLGQGNAHARKCPPALYAIRCPEMPTARFSENGHCPLMPVPEKNARAAHGHLWACHMKVNLC